MFLGTQKNNVGHSGFNGITPPFPSQPVPGFSAVLDAGHGEFWAMPDNGYGAKTNSGDFLLRVLDITGHPVFAALPETVFETMSRLARQHDAINLGQGFPDGQGPDDVRVAAARALESVSNQYPPMMGLPSLRTAIAAHYRHHQGLDLDPEREVMVTSGATEALAGALMALIRPGDEVVLFEPMYDAYLPLVRRAGGVPRFVTLKPPHFS